MSILFLFFTSSLSLIDIILLLLALLPSALLGFGGGEEVPQGKVVGLQLQEESRLVHVPTGLPNK